MRPDPGRGHPSRDLLSANGVYVNGNQVLDTAILHDGDEIEIGSSRFTLDILEGSVEDHPRGRRCPWEFFVRRFRRSLSMTNNGLLGGGDVDGTYTRGGAQFFAPSLRRRGGRRPRPTADVAEQRSKPGGQHTHEKHESVDQQVFRDDVESVARSDVENVVVDNHQLHCD